jgi:trk system potassium uptake protein
MIMSCCSSPISARSSGRAPVFGRRGIHLMRLGAYAPVQRIVGVLLMVLSLGFVPPLIFALANQPMARSMAFVFSLLVVSAVGYLLCMPVRKATRDLRISDGFLVVVACWGAVCLAGAIPFVLALNASLADAVFESTSGITTTGATVFSGLGDMPISIRWYRQQLQWMGGLGIIVLAVAILPMLRVGGMQVYKAEATGPVKESRLTPRIAETAKALWLIYIGLTAVCAAAYWAAGMSLFDAVTHSLLNHRHGRVFDPRCIDRPFRQRPDRLAGGVLPVRRQPQLRPALPGPAPGHGPGLPKRPGAEVVRHPAAAGLDHHAVLLWRQQVYDNFWDSIRYATFQAVSYTTTTGFATADVYLWPGTLPLLLILVSGLGGCAGATTGGFKIIRVYLVTKQGLRELQRLIHPRAVVPLKFGGRTLNQEVANAVWGYVSLYIVCVVVLTLIVSGIEHDLVTAVSVVFSAMNNLGPALGEAGANWGPLSRCDQVADELRHAPRSPRNLHHPGAADTSVLEALACGER